MIKFIVSSIVVLFCSVYFFTESKPEYEDLEFSDVLSISGGRHFLIVATKIGVYSRGENSDGQLGIGNFSRVEKIPQKMSFISNTTEIRSIHCSRNFCVAHLKSGIYSWGYGKIQRKLEIEAKDEKINFIYCKFDFCFASTKVGFYSWGDGTNGLLATGDFFYHHEPQRNEFLSCFEKIKSIGCELDSCIILTNRGVYSWDSETMKSGTGGGNYFAQMGIENLELKYRKRFKKLNLDSNKTISVTCGATFCFIITENDVYSWGNNMYGQFGSGNKKIKPQNKIQPINFPENPRDIISVQCIQIFCVAHIRNGVYSWGRNTHGEIGHSELKYYFSPEKIGFIDKNEDVLSVHIIHNSILIMMKDFNFYYIQRKFGDLPDDYYFFQDDNETMSQLVTGKFHLGWLFTLDLPHPALPYFT